MNYSRTKSNGFRNSHFIDPNYQLGSYSNHFHLASIHNSVSSDLLPSLPKQSEVLQCRNEVEESIKQVKIELATLRQALSDVVSGKKTQVTSEKNSIGLAEIGGFLVSHNLIDTITAQNHTSASLSNQENTIMERHEMPLVNHYPHTISTLENHQNLLSLLYCSVVYERAILTEKNASLANHFDSMNEIWSNQCKHIDSLNSTDHIYEFKWPDEMPQTITRQNHKAFDISATASDVPLNILPSSLDIQSYSDDHLLIADPLSDYLNYSQRVIWTEEEKQIFVDKYLLYPKKFSKIASFLPTKTIKEVIEYYYLKKREIGLTNLNIAKRRGDMKKVLAEGTII